MKRTNLDVLVRARKERLALRDQFAIAALQGLLGSRYVDIDDEGHVEYLSKMSIAAWNLADAMLAKREGK